MLLCICWQWRNWQAMMTFVWTLQLSLNENGKPIGSDYTLNYIGCLAKALSAKQFLYGEIRWRDPLG